MSWDIVRLGDVCLEDKTVIDGKSSSKPYLGLEMIEAETGVIDWSNSSVEGISTCYLFDKRHILYGKLRPYLNKVALPEIDGRCSTEIIPLLLKPDVCREYIAFLLRRKETVDYVMPENTGSRMPRADMNHLLDMEIPLPPLNEQRRIAAEIERQLSIVEKAKQAAAAQMAAARELNAAYLREVFNGNEWKTVKLGDVVTLQRGHDLPAAQFVEGMYPVIGSNGIIGYHNDYTTEAPCLTIGRSGSVGKSFIYNGRAWAHNTALYVKQYQNINLNFFYHVLKMLNVAQYAGFTAVPTLDRNNLTHIPIPLPSIDEQLCIVEHLDKRIEKVEKTLAAVQTQLDAINAMPAAILRQAFSGQM